MRKARTAQLIASRSRQRRPRVCPPAEPAITRINTTTYCLIRQLFEVSLSTPFVAPA